MRYLRMVLRNLGRNRRRTTLTVLSIAVSLFLMTLLITILVAMEEWTATDGSELRLITRHKVSLTNLLPESHWKKIQSVPGVTVACPTTWFGGIYKEERNFFPQFAVDARSFLDLVASQRNFKAEAAQRREWVLDRRGVMVHRELAERYGWKLGDVFTIKGRIYPFDPELKVRAIFSGDDPAIYFHREYLEEAMGRPGLVGSYWLLVGDQQDLSRVAKRVDALFTNSDAETLTETEKAFQAGFISMLGNVQGLMFNLSLVIAFTILMVTANSMSMSIRERITEVAVLKALGFPSAHILGLLLSEAVLLAALGGLLGVGGFWGLSWLTFEVAGARLPMVWFTLVPPWWLAVGLWISSFGLGLTSGILPSVGAARMPILDGLRQV